MYLKKLYDVVTSNTFDLIIITCILFNIITMALYWENQSQEMRTVLEGINYFFTGIFIMEAILKIIAMTPRGYWISGWNKFDLFLQ